MSWSFYAIGRPAAVIAKAKEEQAKKLCQEPEESYRIDTLDLIANTCESFAVGQIVKVEASGSQYKDGDTVRHNQLKLSVEPLGSFLE